MSSRIVGAVGFAATMSALTLGVLTPHASDAAGQQPLPPIACAIAPDKDVPIKAVLGRQISCGLDLGSRTAKLSVVSMVPGSRATVREERVCRRTLGMGAQVFEAASKTARPLPPASIDSLSATIQAFRTICQADRGTIVSAGATQWARDATNIAEVKARVNAATGIDFDVLSPAQEAAFGYIAGSVNTPGRIVLDPGSNSFQISWQPKSGGQIQSVLVEYGYVRASTADFEPAADYAGAIAAYRAKAKSQIATALARLSPPTDVTMLASHVRSGVLGPDLISLGQDGAVHWFVRGALRDDGSWIADAKAYDARVAAPTLLPDRGFGVMASPPIQLSDLQAFIRTLGPADFQALKSDPIKGIYGQRALVTPVLMDLLMSELGLRRLIIVPQEIATGQILARMDKPAR
jgi:hypothetical protein